MYTPEAFKLDDVAAVHALMRSRPFAILITVTQEGPIGTHLPTVLKVDAEQPLGRIECHLARPNPQWRAPASDHALMIFQGPEAYIRPAWYPSKAEHGKVVPTWNYTAVHAYGRLEVVDDPTWLLAHVGELTRQQEASYEAPWATSDAPESFLAAMARGIVGLRFSISRLEGKAKMSQNRPEADRAGVVQGLTRRDRDQDCAVAGLVAERKA